jgi:glycosyltransferase involved in cell wall biosynthesis
MDRVDQTPVPKTILFIADDPAGRGGTEVRLLQTVTSLRQEQWRTLVIVPARGYLYRMLIQAGVDTRLLNFYRFPRFWRVRRFFPIDAWVTIFVNMFRVRRLLKQEGVAIIHSMAKQTLNVRNIAWAARGVGVPVIWSCGDTNPKVLTYCRNGLGASLDRIIATSHHVKEALLRAGIDCPDKIEVVHNAIDVEEWDEQTAAIRRPLREALGVPPGRPLVGLVARLDRVKGQHTFLLAAELVAQAHPDAVFLMVGVMRPTSRWAVFADYFKEIEALAQRPALRGRLLLTGWRTDLPRVMASLDILVQPSQRETFGRVLIEAMASRKAVIATKVGGMPEIVVNGTTGLIVPPEDPSALASAILNLLQDPARCRTMGEAGRARVEELFSISRRIQRLESIHNQVLRQRQSGAERETMGVSAVHQP